MTTKRVLAGLFGCLLLWAAAAHADVYNCSTPDRRLYQTAPCPGGVNLTKDPAVQEVLAVSGPTAFYDPSAEDAYQPLDPDTFQGTDAIQFFERVRAACKRGNLNDFYSTFSGKFRRMFMRMTPEELAHHMIRYCELDYPHERLNKLTTEGRLTAVRTSRTQDGVPKMLLCWSDKADSSCTYRIYAAMESGKLVRDEL